MLLQTKLNWSCKQVKNVKLAIVNWSKQSGKLMFLKIIYSLILWIHFLFLVGNEIYSIIFQEKIIIEHASRKKTKKDEF